MELVQELVFTISFSLIVSLLIAKLFSIASSFDGGNSTVSIRVEEKIDKEGKIEKFEYQVNGSGDVEFECLEGELASGVLIGGAESGSGVGACYVFDESPVRTEFNDGGGNLVKSDEGNEVISTGSLVEEDCVKFVELDTESGSGVGVCYLFDKSPVRTEFNDADCNLVKSEEGNVVFSTGSLVEEDCAKSVEVDTESGSKVGVCYVFDESPERAECKDGEGKLVESGEGNVVISTGSLVEEDCVTSVEVDTESGGGVGVCYVFDESPVRTECKDGGGGLGKRDEGNVVNSTGTLTQEDCVKSIDEEDEMFDDDDWQGVETTELERRFGAAVAFVDAKVNSGVVNLIDNEVKIELYGLHRVAIEGSCFEPQPMALKVFARANWNSWKRLENLEREDAMEQYIALLSQHVPGWMRSHSYDKQ